MVSFLNKDYKTDKTCIEKILKYINDIKICLSHFRINSFNELKNERLAQLAITQSITNIYEVKRLINQEILNEVSNFDNIKISAARNIASHDYESVNFKIIYDVCNKLTANTVMEELENEYNNLWFKAFRNN